MGPRGSGAGKRLLVADDDRDIRETLRELLELEGYEVATARNGAEALEQMRALRPDLVLLDLFMPVLDGVEVCRARQADPGLAAIPVIVISAAPGLDDRLDGLQLAGHLEKPVRIERLFEAVARHCS